MSFKSEPFLRFSRSMKSLYFFLNGKEERMPYNEAGKMIHYKYFGLIGLSEVIYDNKTTAKAEGIFCFRLVPIIKQLTEDFPIKVTF